MWQLELLRVLDRSCRLNEIEPGRVTLRGLTFAPHHLLLIASKIIQGKFVMLEASGLLQLSITKVCMSSYEQLGSGPVPMHVSLDKTCATAGSSSASIKQKSRHSIGNTGTFV
jgi:hypothetical protein